MKVKSQKFSELDIGGIKTCLPSGSEIVATYVHLLFTPSAKTYLCSARLASVSPGVTEARRESFNYQNIPV